MFGHQLIDWTVVEADTHITRRTAVRDASASMNIFLTASSSFGTKECSTLFRPFVSGEILGGDKDDRSSMRIP